MPLKDLNKAKEYRKIWMKNLRKKNPDRAREYYKKAHNSVSGKYSEYKFSAKSRDLVFELSKNDFIKFWNVECFFCGVCIDGVGIDRLDNEIGYTLGNCVSCCRMCNVAKSIHSYEDFIERCHMIVSRHRNPYDEGGID